MSLFGGRPRGLVPDRPGPGQESVWDYPRPPRLEPVPRSIEVVHQLPEGDVVLLSTRSAYRVLETSHPPTYYLPLADALEGAFRPADGSSFCEWKGMASYLDVGAPGHPVAVAAGGWTYPEPTAAFAALAGHVALYPRDPLRCTVDGEVVRAQPGGFYGGWVTDSVVGPFKGAPGTGGW